MSKQYGLRYKTQGTPALYIDCGAGSYSLQESNGYAKEQAKAYAPLRDAEFWAADTLRWLAERFSQAEVQICELPSWRVVKRLKAKNGDLS